METKQLSTEELFQQFSTIKQFITQQSTFSLKSLKKFLQPEPQSSVYIILLIERDKSIKLSKEREKIIFDFLLSCHPSYEKIKKDELTYYEVATLISQIWRHHSNLCINCFHFRYYSWKYSYSIRNQFPHLSTLCTGCARKRWDRLTRNESIKIPFTDLLINNVNYQPYLTPSTICLNCHSSSVSDWPSVWKTAFPPLMNYCFECALILYPFHIIPTVEVINDKTIPNRTQTFYAPSLRKHHTKYRLVVPKVLVTDISSIQQTSEISKKRKRKNNVDDVLETIGDISPNRKTSDSHNGTDTSDMRNSGSLRRSSRNRKRLVLE